MNERILIVEDENLVALDIELGLKRLGYRVVGSVNNGADALKKVAEFHPQLILMDIQIKGDLDGIETSQKIQEKYNVPVVFLTAHADEATLQRAKIAGPFGYVLKPFEETALHTAIQVALQKHQTTSEQQKTTLHELELSEERFKILVDSVRDYAICILNLDGIVISWNQGAKRTFGYNQEEIKGQNFSRFCTEEDILNGTSQWELDQAKIVGSIADEGWRRRKDGTKFWAHVSITRMVNASNDPIGYSVVTRDLTERKRTEDRIRLANEGLEKRIEERTARLVEALQIRDEFLSIASHELKNPLATMCMQLTLLGRHINDFFSQSLLPQDFNASNTQAIDKLTKAVLSCERQSKRLVSLIDQLMDLTRIRIGKIEINKSLVDLAEVAAEIIERQKTDSPMAPEISFLPPKKAIVGKWDRSRLEQIITNLLSNAIKYGAGKPIELQLDTDVEAQVAHIRVIDHGIGIPFEMQETIFDKFQRAVEVQNITGLGLGLYIVRQVVEAHKGHIYVQSQPKLGSTFIVELPLGIENASLLASH